MESQCKLECGGGDEGILVRKLTDLELMIQQLQQNLMDEKLKLTSHRMTDEDQLPDNWTTMNRLHLPQCPMATLTPSAPTRNASCPLHGNRAKIVPQKKPVLQQSFQQPPKRELSTFDSAHYSKRLSDADKLIRDANVNEKLLQLYESSIYSPAYYTPLKLTRDESKTDLQNDLEGDNSYLVRQESTSEESLSKVSNDYELDIIEVDSPTRNSSSSSCSKQSSSKSRESFDENSIKEVKRTEYSSDSFSSKSRDSIAENNIKEVKRTEYSSDCESSADVFNPFDAIKEARTKFMEIENYVQSASMNLM